MKVQSKSYIAKKEEVEHKWLLVDAEGKTLGRMATQIATILMGKHKPIYTPHVDTGDNVIVLNAAKVHMTGKKVTDKEYAKYTGWSKGHKTMSVEKIQERKPELIVKYAIRRMLPKTRLGETMFQKLKVYPDTEHPHAAQKPEKIDLRTS